MADPTLPSSSSAPEAGRSATFYEPVDADTYRPTLHAQGAWSDAEQHMAPVSGLLAHVIETRHPRPDLQLARISYDIFGFIALADSTVATRVVRAGRTIELVEATLTIKDRVAIRASAWRLSRQDTTPVAGDFAEPMPDPESLRVSTHMDVWGGGYIESVEFRVAPGWQPGRGRVWLRSEVDVVAGEAASDGARFLRLVDTANGIAVRADPTTWMFPNTDLTVHLFRTPVGEWVGLDNQVSFGTTGVGLTSTTLHDIEGPVGRAEQILTVRPMPTD